MGISGQLGGEDEGDLALREVEVKAEESYEGVERGEMRSDKDRHWLVEGSIRAGLRGKVKARGRRCRR